MINWFAKREFGISLCQNIFFKTHKKCHTARCVWWLGAKDVEKMTNSNPFNLREYQHAGKFCVYGSLVAFVWIFKNQMKERKPHALELGNTSVWTPRGQGVNALVCGWRSHCLEDGTERSGPRSRSRQSRVGPLVGRLLEGRGWPPAALASGPRVWAESRAGAERWWKAAFCWWKLFM